MMPVDRSIHLVFREKVGFDAHLASLIHPQSLLVHENAPKDVIRVLDSRKGRRNNTRPA